MALKSPNRSGPIAPLRRPWVLEGLYAAILTGVVRLLAGSGAPGYDATWSLVWGRQLAQGQTPDFLAAMAPTPHPLTNLMSAALAPLAVNHAMTAILALHWLALAALAWGVLRLGGRVFGPAVGVLAAAIVTTREQTALVAAQTLVDAPFLAFVTWAGALAVTRPRGDVRVAALLALAGLLRPEAWPLALAYGVWALPGQGRGHRILIGAVLAAGPAIWGLMDLLVTGDPAHSLHGTQALARELERETGALNAVASVPGRLGRALMWPVAVAGVAGLMAALVWRHPSRALVLPFGIAMACYVALGAAGLPLWTRYLAVPLVVLGMFAAFATLGWRYIEVRDRRRRPWRIAGLVLAASFLVTAPIDVARLRSVDAGLEIHRVVRDEIRSAARTPSVVSSAGRCGGVVTDDFRTVPALRLWFAQEVTYSPQPAVTARPAVVFRFKAGDSAPAELFDGAYYSVSTTGC